jgi:ABC-type transport system involved in multi-copper enzyme maturation permease subunit
MNTILKITRYTLRDQLRQKSVYVLLGLSIFFILMIRGCYNGEYAVNGRMADSYMVARNVSKIVFHLITAGMYLMAAMLSMKLFSRDREDGSMVLFLSRSVFRWQYVLGRVSGTFLLCLVFMFLLHLTISLTVWAKTGAIIPEYPAASLVISINLLFVIACVCLLSLFMPDFISALFTIGILLVGFISDGGYKILTSDLVRSAAPSMVDSNPAMWRILYPKVFMVQAYADAILSKNQFHNMGTIHPLLNISVFILLIIVVMLVSFHRKEI